MKATFAQKGTGLHQSGHLIHFKPTTADLVRGLEIVPTPAEDRAEQIPVATV